MTDDMVERVAHALFAARFSPDNYNSRLFAEARKICLRDAILMIGAMREPTEKMVTAAGKMHQDVQIGEKYRVMIDAALGKPSGGA